MLAEMAIIVSPLPLFISICNGIVSPGVYPATGIVPIINNGSDWQQQNKQHHENVFRFSTVKGY